MQQFATGIIVGALIVLSGMLVRRKLRGDGPPRSRRSLSSGRQGDAGDHLRQLEELSKITGGLAHEIKNPLSTVKINLKLIREDLEGSAGAQSGGAVERSDPRFARALRKMAVVQKEADRLEQILSDFLRFVDRGQLQPEIVDVNELISDMVDFYWPQSHSHSVTLRHCLYAGPLVCKLDASMVKQAILNLFINAQQAMSEGGELMVRTDRQGQEAVIQINDTGCGIDAEKLPHIFEAFYSSWSQGTGLGLATAKKIVQEHGGTISVDSEPGKGTSFTIRFRLQDQ